MQPATATTFGAVSPLRGGPASGAAASAAAAPALFGIRLTEEQWAARYATDRAAWETERAAWDTERAQLTASLEASEAARVHTATEFDAFRATHAQWQSQHSEAHSDNQRSIAELEAQLSAARTQLATLTANVQAQSSTIDSLLTQRTALTARIEALIKAVGAEKPLSGAAPQPSETEGTATSVLNSGLSTVELG